MKQSREDFVEPEIIKHEEKLADVTAVRIGTATDDLIDAAPAV
jgi:hypothetical protein